MNRKIKAAIYGTLILLLFVSFIALCVFDLRFLMAFFGSIFSAMLIYIFYAFAYERSKEKT